MHAQESDDDGDFSPGHGSGYEKFDEEKVDFPSFPGPIPTFAAAYDQEVPEEPLPAHLPAGARVLGPRFFNQANEQVELPTSSASPPRQKGHLARQESNSSQHSVAWSLTSGESALSTSSKGKRWVIE